MPKRLSYDRPGRDIQTHQLANSVYANSRDSQMPQTLPSRSWSRSTSGLKRTSQTGAKSPWGDCPTCLWSWVYSFVRLVVLVFDCVCTKKKKALRINHP
mmetsp:Transcript_4219/g.6188  ORF Transcript_4219/g.6188 Transcript_4219/m.6188 type:complete len:99 (-) Transcript_4219:162-458(-)